MEQQAEEGWVSTTEVGRRLHVPRVFLAKIFQKLVKAKIIKTQRGKTGGVRLLKKQTSMADVISVLEPRSQMNKCLDQKYNCSLQASCQIHPVLRRLENNLFAELGHVTLARIAMKGRRKGYKE